MMCCCRVAKREHSASIIQTIARVRIAVTLKYRKMGVFHLINRAFPAAAVKIQSIVRGFLGRKKFWRHLDKELM